jgi:serine/threonine protein kinase
MDESNRDILNVERIGFGSYGIVYSSKKGDKALAVKRNLKIDNVDFINSIRELDLLIRIKGHPYLIELLSVSFGNPFGKCMSPINRRGAPEGEIHKHVVDDNVHFVFEKATCDLHDMIYTMKLDAKQYAHYVKLCIQQTLLGLEFIHSQEIIHRDIKTSNVLCFLDNDDKPIFKLCDFGMAKMYTNQGKQTPRCVTHWYRSPEICFGNNYDYACDVWALGCIYFEMIQKKALFNEIQDNELVILKKIINTVPDHITRADLDIMVNGDMISDSVLNTQRTKKLSWGEMIKPRQSFIAAFNSNKNRERKKIKPYAQFLSMLNMMLQFNPKKRYTASQCLSHEYFHESQTDIGVIRQQFPPVYVKQEPKIGTPIGDNYYEERSRFTRLLLSMYENQRKLDWLKPRLLFSAMSLFFKYLATEPKRESDEKMFLRFFIFIYISLKFHSTVDYTYSMYEMITMITRYCDRSVFYQKFDINIFKSHKFMLIGEEFELNLIRDIVKCQIYEPTLYEIADRFNHVLSFEDGYNLLKLWGLMKKINGIPVQVVYQIYKSIEPKTE